MCGRIFNSLLFILRYFKFSARSSDFKIAQRYGLPDVLFFYSKLMTDSEPVQNDKNKPNLHWLRLQGGPKK